MKQGLKRIELLDILRGLALLLMICHHGLYDLVVFYGYNIPFLESTVFYILQFIFSGLFIFIAGCTSNFSRSNIKRGVYCLIAAFLITAISFIVVPDSPVYFGILHLLGTCMLLYGLLEKCFLKIHPKYGFLFWILLFALGYYIYRNAAYVNNPYLFILGFITKGFSSSDYYPLMPYMFLFLSGTSAGRIMAKGEMPGWFYSFKPIPIISFLGKHSIWVYLLHQPILMAAFLVFLGLPF